MTDPDSTDFEEGTPQRFAVQLFIRHPTMHPAEITAALGMDPLIQHVVGEPRRTSTGTHLPGIYQRTGWRYSNRYEVKDQWFAEELTELVDRLVPHKDFLHGLRSTGGQAMIVVQFLGDDGHFGDEIPSETLAKLVDLKLDLGLEVYMVPQS